MRSQEIGTLHAFKYQLMQQREIGMYVFFFNLMDPPDYRIWFSGLQSLIVILCVSNKNTNFGIPRTSKAIDWSCIYLSLCYHKLEISQSNLLTFVYFRYF